MPNESMDRISRVLHWGAGSFLPRAIRRSCARKFRRRNLGKTLKVPTQHHCQLRVIIGDNVDNEIALTGAFEPHLSALIHELSSHQQGNFLDVGCHLGYYSTLVKKNCPSAVITAVDANPVMAQRCRDNLQLNGFTGDVINTGVGAEHAVLTFRTSRQSPSLGTFGESPPAGLEIETIQVQVVPFRDILDRTHGPVFLLKMDVEGFEYLALSTLRDDQVDRIENLVFEFSEERLQQCGQSREAFLTLPWLDRFEAWLIHENGTRSRLNSLAEVPGGDQNVWLKRKAR